MGLFNKKLSLDDILKGIDALTPEEKAKVKEKIGDLDKAEDEREIDKIEETKADTEEVKEEKGEEVTEESEEIGKDVDEIKETAEGEETPEEETAEEVTPDDIPEDTEQDKAAEDNAETVIKGLTDRVTALEEALKDFDELKKLMEDFTAKQAKQFGYAGAIPGGKKPMDEMSAAELKKGILNGEY